MSIRVALHHKTVYHYDRLVSLSPQVIRLRPAPHCRTPIVSYSIKIEPKKQFLNWQQDPYGNFLARAVFPEQTRELSVEVDLVTEMTVINPFDFFLEPEAIDFPFEYSPALQAQLLPYCEKEAPSSIFEEFVRSAPRKSVGTVDFLVDLNRYVHDAVKYVIRLEPGVQSCVQTLERGSGSCRDSAWLLAQLVRHMGLAARFVSGYLIQLKPDVVSLDGPSGAAVDFTDLHAWTEVFLPGAGWVGLDPTSGLLAGEGHIPLAATPDPESAAPISGAVDECETTFSFDMSLKRIHEDPRVTKPYSEEQWLEIERLGEHVDRSIAAGMKTFTMGGEPTFVSIDDRDGPEWNTAALGESKRKLAGTLFNRLAGKFANQPLLHFGQGKWYPGEQLPRWALSCYWRKDKEPIWTKPELTAEDGRDYQCDEKDAEAFIKNLAEHLKVDVEHVIPGFEDIWFYMLKERKLPVNVDPLKSKLTSPEDRKRIAKVFEQGLDKVVGYVLPLRPVGAGSGLEAKFDSDQPVTWESGRWFLRQEHLFLIPGDSAMGYRLPLDSLPWVAPEDYPHIQERDPMSPREALPDYASFKSREGSVDGTTGAGRNGFATEPMFAHPTRLISQIEGLTDSYAGVNAKRSATSDAASLEIAGTQATVARSNNSGCVEIRGTANPDAGIVSVAMVDDSAFHTSGVSETSPVPAMHVSAREVVRTAICVEPRDGVLHVFMPPVSHIEEYLDLVSAIEATAFKLKMPVRIEGYTPPHDPRVDYFRITPDPGVIEVNLQPAKSWRELVHNTDVLYEEARQSRLCTEKFMLDGRHTGTGGGNHIVLGGPTPAESPFLRRPDVLRSLIAYWNNRPSLSYLFSGLFIGPTSQAPRADEARHESIYELDIACAQLPEKGPVPPWLVDRVFRHLLVDLTGNTHRAEFCIDKLFSPDSATGRLGLLEMRGFEMPPHERMSLTQQLLVRALVAKFWDEPYRQPLVRWGTTLHDRFMLPHFVIQDLEEVLEDLADSGFAFEKDWFAPHVEFRFPVIGHVIQRGVKLELRQAIEPWHVLGEEPGGGGAVRFVDSSIERVQVKVTGLTDTRHVITCNGRRVPLRPTGVQGEYVAGVRFRAWQPPSCLHPTIGVHVPLVFDILDTWNGRSIGGCSWHVSHPGGRSFATFPVNAYEAESRRVARFFAIGHTPGSQIVPPIEVNADYPLTLDLRKPPQSAMPGI